MRANPAAQLKPADAGQHHIQDHQRGWVAFQQSPRLVAAGGLKRPATVALEVAHDHVAHDRLVIDHEDGGHERIVRARDCRDLKWPVTNLSKPMALKASGRSRKIGRRFDVTCSKRQDARIWPLRANRIPTASSCTEYIRAMRYIYPDEQASCGHR